MKYVLIVSLLFATQLLNAQTESYQNQEVLIQFSNSVNPEEWIKTNKHVASFSISQVISKRLGIYRLSYAESMDAKILSKQLHQIRGVLTAQVNHNNVINRATPNDQGYPQQWQFNDAAPGSSFATQAWDFTTGGYTSKGDTIVVAVIDGGYALDHNDLNFYTNSAEIPNNGIDDDANGYIDDVQGWNASNQSGTHPLDDHGTHVSGIIGAKGNNGIGVTGVNWDVEVLPITSVTALESDVLIAYGYALDMRAVYNQTNGAEGAYVVATNSSFGFDYANPANFPLWCAFYDSLGAYGILSAGATANLGINVDVTGDVPTGCVSNFLVSVTNTTVSATRNNGAAYGTNSIDLGAPGSGIYSTDLFQNYSFKTGTSMATPMVAGTIGLMHSILCQNYYDDYAGREDDLALFLKDVLLATVTPQTDIQNTTVSGGRLNIYGAIDSLMNYNCIRGVEITNSDTCRDCNGSATVQLSDGEYPYSFNWNTGLSDSLLIGCMGNYVLTVTDDLGFQKEFNISINENDPLESNATVNNTVNGSDGSISLNPSGANDGVYSYQWNTGESSSMISGLAEGTYTVTISSGPCELIESFDIVATGFTDFLDEDHLRVYPNPASTVLTLEANESIANATLIDLRGRIVYQQNQSANRVVLDISNMASGLYMLSVKSSAGKEILTKVTIQH